MERWRLPRALLRVTRGRCASYGGRRHRAQTRARVFRAVHSTRKSMTPVPEISMGRCATPQSRLGRQGDASSARKGAHCASLASEGARLARALPRKGLIAQACALGNIVHYKLGIKCSTPDRRQAKSPFPCFCLSTQWGLDARCNVFVVQPLMVVAMRGPQIPCEFLSTPRGSTRAVQCACCARSRAMCGRSAM